MIVFLSLAIPIDRVTVLSALEIVGGLYFLFLGLTPIARKRAILGIPTSNTNQVPLGQVELHGTATAPYPNPITAPLSGKPCFFYQTTAWQQSEANQQEWQKVADETLHLPFFLEDPTGQLLIEPLGAELNLPAEFQKEYQASELSGTPPENSEQTNDEDISARLAAFLFRHKIAPTHPLRIEERLIQPDDAVWIVGTVMENPGIQLRPVGTTSDELRDSTKRSQSTTPQIIRLEGNSTPTSTQNMSQQAKIAAALNRAGITKPEAWSAAGIDYSSIAVEDKVTHQEIVRPEQPASTNFNVTPPLVMMKGPTDSNFIISDRSQKESAVTSDWKASAMVCIGALTTVFGLYMLLTEIGVL